MSSFRITGKSAWQTITWILLALCILLSIALIAMIAYQVSKDVFSMESFIHFCIKSERFIILSAEAAQRLSKTERTWLRWANSDCPASQTLVRTTSGEELSDDLTRSRTWHFRTSLWTSGLLDLIFTISRSHYVVHVSVTIHPFISNCFIES